MCVCVTWACVLCYAANERLCRDTFSSLVRLAREDSRHELEQYNYDQDSEEELWRYAVTTRTCIDAYIERSTSNHRQWELES